MRSNQFEIHIGFPVHIGDEADVLICKLQALGSKGWTKSLVSDVYTNPSVIDPHNVPGTLGYLVSRDFAPAESAILLEETKQVLALMGTSPLENARVELEFAFGSYLPVFLEHKLVNLRKDCVAALGFEDAALLFPGASRIENAPKWEIHFVIEKRKNEESSPPGEMTVLEATEILAKHRVRTEQTIRYHSSKMLDQGETLPRLICTSYYFSEEETLRAAERLSEHLSLARDFSDRGFEITLILERIIACFQPLCQRTSEGQQTETVSPDYS